MTRPATNRATVPVKPTLSDRGGARSPNPRNESTRVGARRPRTAFPPCNFPRRAHASGAFWSIPYAKNTLAAAVAALTLTATAQAEEYKPEISPMMRLLPGAAGCPTEAGLIALLKDIADPNIPAPAGCLQVRARSLPVVAEYIGHFDIGDWRWYVIQATDFQGNSMLVPVERRKLDDVLGTAL